MNLNYRGISSVIGGFILHLVIGCFYLWGVINIYVTSYYRLKGEQYLNTSLTSGLFPVFLLFVGISFMFSLKFAKRIGLKVACFVESFWMTLSVFLSSFMPDFWSFMFFFAISYGLASGLLYLLPIYICSLHFPQKKGLISGVIVSGNGIATLIAGQMSQRIINPNNEKVTSTSNGSYFDADIADQVPIFLRYLSLYFLILSIIGSFLIIPKKENEVNAEEVTQNFVNNYNNSNAHENNISENNYNDNENNGSIIDKLKTRDFQMLFWMNLFSSGFGLMISVKFKDYGLTKINDDEFLTLIGSIGFIFNSSFRIIWGSLMDIFGFRKVYWVLLIFQLALICSLDSISAYRSAYFIWICFILACEGGHFSLFPAITMKQFGIKEGGSMYPYVYFAFVISNFIQFLIILECLDDISYANIFWIYAGFTFISIILNFFFQERKKIE